MATKTKPKENNNPTPIGAIVVLSVVLGLLLGISVASNSWSSNAKLKEDAKFWKAEHGKAVDRAEGMFENNIRYQRILMKGHALYLQKQCDEARERAAEQRSDRPLLWYADSSNCDSDTVYYSLGTGQ